MLDIERIAGANGRAFRLVGDLDGGVIRQLQRILSGPASDGEGLTVDLSGLDSCDTECARLLITLSKRARIAEGDLVLTAPIPAVLQALMKIAGPDELNIVMPKVAKARTAKVTAAKVKVANVAKLKVATKP
jgi:anti-anti-sigma regulatory factor